MTVAHRRYFATEMAVAAAINALLSGAFCFLVFGGQAQVPISGWGGVVADAAPQSFMIALMSCLVPTLLTRRRMAAGAVGAMPRWCRLPRALAPRAAAIAAAAALLAVVAHAILLPRFGTSWRFSTVCAFKCVYGAALGMGVAAISIRIALGEQPPTSGDESATARDKA